MFDTTATLYTENTTLDGALNEVHTYEGRQVYVRKARSVYASEFYEAAAQGLKPAVVLVIFFGDYQNEKLIGWQGGYYGVTRAYQRQDSDHLELTLEQKLEYIDAIEEVSA